jgi:hypothetical protein
MSALSEWAKHSASDDFWLVAAIAIVVAVASFASAFYFFMRKRIMEDMPTSKIRSAAQGYIEVDGKGDLLEGPPIIGPLTGKTCTWYSYKIEERRRNNKNSNWTTIEKGKSEELFLIIDDTGECVIDPEGASVTPSEKDVWHGATTRPTQGPASKAGLLSSGRYRYSESRLHPKEPLYAMGLFNTVGGAGDVFDPNSDVREILKEWKQNSEAMLAKFDTNKDSEIDMQEWQAVRAAALKEVMARHNERKVETPVNLLTRTRDARRPFLLSAVPQHSLIKRYQLYSAMLIMLFFTSGSFASWILKLRLTGT